MRNAVGELCRQNAVAASDIKDRFIASQCELGDQSRPPFLLVSRCLAIPLTIEFDRTLSRSVLGTSDCQNVISHNGSLLCVGKSTDSFDEQVVQATERPENVCRQETTSADL